MEPTPQAAAEGFAFYFSLVPRGIYFADFWLLEPGDTVNGNRHPGLDYDETVFQALLGIHVAWKRFAMHLTYYYFPSQIAKPVVAPPPGTERTETTLEWANVSLEYRW